MKKILARILSVCIILFATTNINAESLVNSKETEFTSKINHFFEDYFSAFDGTYGSMKDADCEVIDDFAYEYNNYLYNLNKEYDLFSTNLYYDLHDMNVNKNEDELVVKVLCDYRLVYDSTGVDSVVSNEEFTFKIIKVNDAWCISEIESTDLLYKSLREKYIKLKETKAVNSTDFFTEQLESMVKYHEYEKESIDNRYEYQVPATRASYSYNSSDGVEYASVFAEADDSDWIFYDAGLDCTNFVSQCVWASYAGFDKNNIAQAVTNINNDKCMVTSYPSGWHASGPGGGGYPNWESVTNFYDYCVSSKTYGPNGTGWGGYSVTSLSPYAPSVGNVLQWSYSSSSSSYSHSTYVTYNSYNGSTNGVYVSYHTSDNYNRPLTYLINAYDYVRGISFSSANF